MYRPFFPCIAVMLNEVIVYCYSWFCELFFIGNDYMLYSPILLNNTIQITQQLLYILPRSTYFQIVTMT